MFEIIFCIGVYCTLLVLLGGKVTYYMPLEPWEVWNRAIDAVDQPEPEKLPNVPIKHITIE